MLNSAQLRKQAGGACLEQINNHIYRRVVPGRAGGYVPGRSEPGFTR